MMSSIRCGRPSKVAHMPCTQRSPIGRAPCTPHQNRELEVRQSHLHACSCTLRTRRTNVSSKIRSPQPTGTYSWAGDLVAELSYGAAAVEVDEIDGAFALEKLTATRDDVRLSAGQLHSEVVLAWVAPQQRKLREATLCCNGM